MEQMQPFQGEPEIMGLNPIAGIFAATLSTLARVGQIDRELLCYSENAMELALALFPDPELAFQIALEAALGVKRIANDKEHNRRYYQGGKTTKVLLSRAQLFQQMILCESQIWEKYQETSRLLCYLKERDEKGYCALPGAQDLSVAELTERLARNQITCDARLARLAAQLVSIEFDEMDLVVRYLVFLAQAAIDNNSSYVALVFSNMIYNFSLPRVSDICSFLNPAALGGHYLYRLRNKLILRIKERFGAFLVCDGEGGQERFKTMVEDVALSGLVRQWCERLIPLGTACLVRECVGQESFDEQLYNWLNEIDSEDQCEMARSHIVICPWCFEKVIAECRVKGRSTAEAERLPTAELAIPLFHLPSEKGNSQMPKIGRKHRAVIESKVSDSVAASLPAWASIASREDNLQRLLVFIDGEQQDELNLTQHSSVRLRLGEEARLIKLMARDREGLVLHAALLLRTNEISRSLRYRLLGWKRYSVNLINRQKLTFAVKLASDNIDESGFIVDISYRKNLFNTLSSFLRLPSLELSPGTLFRPANVILFTITAICLFSLFIFFYPRPQSNSNNQWANAQQQLEDSKQSRSTPLSPQPAPTSLSLQNGEREQQVDVKRKPVQPKQSSGQTGGNREDKVMSASRQHSVELADVELIHIDPFAGETGYEELETLLREELTRGQFESPEKRDSADAIMQGSIIARRSRTIIELRLVNREGSILLQHGFVIGNDPATTVNRIIDFLIAERSKARSSRAKRP